MPGKRQHYVPKFMLRRFAIDPEEKGSLIHRLDRRTGKPTKRNPINEVVEGRYYRIVDEEGTADDSADELLDRLETKAAPVIRRLVDNPNCAPGDEEIFWLSLFLATLKHRTPEGRDQLHQADVRIAELTAEVTLSNRDLVSEGTSDADRARLLEELRAGDITFESTPSREVALMFVALQQVSEHLATQMRWTLLRAPERSSFVLSDHPVTHYDPTPKMRDAGWGYASSPNAQTFVPIDPRFALLLEPDVGFRWGLTAIEASDVDDINLMVYAQARGAIYGPSQQIVTRVRANAKGDPAKVGRFTLRPPRIWTTDVPEGALDGGVRRFTSTYKGRDAAATLYVSPEGDREARRNAWPPNR